MERDWLPWAYRQWWKPIAADPVRLARWNELQASNEFQSLLDQMDEFDHKPRKWYRAIWFDCSRPVLYRWRRLCFWVSFDVLHIVTKGGYWHLLHNDVVLCPDCDYKEECPEWRTSPEHLCIAEMGKAADFKKPSWCHYCQRSTSSDF